MSKLSLSLLCLMVWLIGCLIVPIVPGTLTNCPNTKILLPNCRWRSHRRVFDCLWGFTLCFCRCRWSDLISPWCFAHFIPCFLPGFVCDQAGGRVDLVPATCPHVWEDDSGNWSSSQVIFIFERTCTLALNVVYGWQVSMFCHGARVGFYQGDITLLMDDIKTLKPTFFPVVPRLLNRIYDKVVRRTRHVQAAICEKRYLTKPVSCSLY